MKKNLIKLTLLVLILESVFTSCSLLNTKTKGNTKYSTDYIDLTADKWAKGEIVKLKDDKTDEQWFKFVATATMQRIYVKLNTLKDLNVYLYNSSSEIIGNYFNVSGDTGKVGYYEFSLREDETYYVKVTGYNSNYVGTYWIGFTDFPAQPETVITELNKNNWKNGNIVRSNNGGTGEEWFTFDATASTQYVFVRLSTCTDFDVYLYDCHFNQIGNKWNPYGSSGEVKKTSWALSPDETYYIKANNGAGPYWIGFTDFPAQPETVITELSANTWTNGNIIKQVDGGAGEQWFKFTATSSTQYIFAKFSTCRDFNVYLYDSYYNQIGNRWNPYGSSGEVKKSSWGVNYGETYYIKADSGVGTYWITFNPTGQIPN